MTITTYQIIAPLVSLVAIVYAWGLVFRQKKTIWEGTLWTGFWLAIAVIAIFPFVLDYLTFVTGFKDRQNALIMTFLGILAFIIFGLIIRIEELEQRQTKLTRSIALRDAGLEKQRIERSMQ